jgi:hypothetical protein
MDLREFRERHYSYIWQNGRYWDIVAARLKRAADIILKANNAAFEKLVVNPL